MGIAQSYLPDRDGYYVLRKACLMAENGLCLPASMPSLATGDTGNSFYKVANKARQAAAFTSSVLHSRDRRSLFYARNALGPDVAAARAAVVETILKPAHYFAQHPGADPLEPATQEAIKDMQLPPDACLRVRPCDTVMQPFCCTAQQQQQQQRAPALLQQLPAEAAAVGDDPERQLRLLGLVVVLALLLYALLLAL